MITVGFVGLGLIGGSIAKALKKSSDDIYVVAYNRSPAPLARAVEDGVVDRCADSVGSAFSDCDIIFLCTPVEHNSTYLSVLRDLIRPGAIITDVGSVKGHIHRIVSDLNMDGCFIGGHPMAGSEKTGYEASTDILLQNAYYAVTPTKLTSPSALEFYVDIIKRTGAIPIITDADRHDYAVAGISHVPHLIASSLVNLVADNDTDDELMRLLAAGGFKDITRIASSSAQMWSQIASANAKQISRLLKLYIESLTRIKADIDNANKDAIFDMFIRSKEYRDSINVKKGEALYQSHALYCDIEDREGAISEITLLLSDNGINIKNIEIIHNREYTEGVMMIEFYNVAAYNSAYDILTHNNYIVHK